jgi:hypothetical protein
MEILPKQPKNIKTQPPDLIATDAYQGKNSVFAPEDLTISSIGELLLPYLLGTMQACWIAAILIGLASAGLFASSTTLIPLFAPFILILGALFLFHYLGMRTPKETIGDQPSRVKISLSETSVFLIVFAIASLCFIWLNMYAQKAFLFDPRWVLSLVKDIVFLNGNFYEAVCILGLTFLLGWMGIRLINRNVEPSDVFRALFVGLSVFVAVIVLRAGQAKQGAVIHDDLSLLLLIPLFLFVSLMAHALARVVFIRKSHPTGLQGSIIAQERAIILLIGVLGLAFLIVAILIGGTTNSFLSANLDHILAVIGVMYNWLVDIVAALIVIIVIPIFWLMLLLHPTTQFGKIKTFHVPKTAANPSILSMQEAFAHTVIPVLSIVLPILFVVLMTLLIRWTLRRRSRVRKRKNRRNLDMHESLWSWSLFWMQLRSVVLVLFARFMHRSTTTENGAVKIEEIQGEPAARSIRETYRALLRKATRLGYPRKRFETPSELKQRIDEKVPLTEPHLELITEAYVFTRYGGEVPDDAQLAQVRVNWTELDRKWT